jgi:hypothetical protein
MSAEHDAYYNLAERIDEAFTEIDSDICTDLREKDSEYIEMWQEASDLQKKFPVIPIITEGKGPISLSTEEHEALVRFLMLKNDMEDIERKQIYFRGHTDNYHYLKRIGVL